MRAALGNSEPAGAVEAGPVVTRLGGVPPVPTGVRLACLNNSVGWQGTKLIAQG